MSVEGTWNLVIATPIGRQQAVLRLFMQDGALHDVATGEAEEVPLTGLECHGDRLTWRQSITKPMRLHLAFDVTVTQDALAWRPPTASPRWPRPSAPSTAAPT
ncbi:hypothetical protein [Streptomyces sp. NPDC090036]|uniref:hypothetical protein n=1 Tax=Streptomyces sp. NPDC090036 TaxID=3365926 RepID=UPI00381EAADA